ncbi:MAG: glycosyltransferase family 4 protein [Acidobacteriota bacterium]|nr:glycosyltransferase family 4 protein [Acidobacteriota bacterium]
MKRPEALFLTPESPYPTIGGGPLRTASLLEYLVQQYTVAVVVFRQPGEEDPRNSFPGGKVRDIHVLELPLHSKSPSSRLLRNGVRFVRNRPPLLDRFSGFESALQRIGSGRQYDVGVIEHFWCAPYATQLRAACRKLVLDLHNVESVWHDRLAHTSTGVPALAHKRFAAAYRRLERTLLPQFDSVLVTSAADRNLVAPFAAPNAIKIYPNALPLIPLPRRAEQFSIVFSGNLEYEPNIAAVRFFAAKIWPVLRERWPGLIWEIIGKNPQAIARIVAGDSSIRLTGPVPDAVSAIARSQVAVVPLLAGSGTRLKILEAWAAGTPVVSTTLGAEGLDYVSGETLLLADAPRPFAEQVSNLLESSQERNRIGQAGRQLYESSYTWQAAWRSLSF